MNTKSMQIYNICANIEMLMLPYCRFLPMPNVGDLATISNHIPDKMET